MHLGLILPNYGGASNAAAIRAQGEAAEEFGFDSVFAIEHVLVGAAAREPFGRIYAPLVTLGWVAGFTERVALGTSIVVLPLHHPIHLAKEVATLQQLASRPILLGLGVGWHEEEFGFLGAGFRDRGGMTDEALQVMAALWRGDRSYAGDRWSFTDASFAPLPDPVPELWFGGASDRSVQRAFEHRGVWHPHGNDLNRLRAAKQRHPELRMIPAVLDAPAGHVERLLEIGADGVVVRLEDAAAIRAFARRYR